MLKHSFSDFSYAVNIDSAKRGHKEILVCYIYNGKEVLRKVYVPEGPGISYIFEARKIIDKEIKDGTLASYSYRFVRRNKKRRIKPRKIVTAVSEGKSIASASGFAGFTYAVKPSANLRKKFVEVNYTYNGEKVTRTLKLRGKENDDFIAKAKAKIKEETESGFLEKYSDKYLKDKQLLNSTPTRTPVVRSGFTGKTIATICVVAALVITGTALGVYFGTRNVNPDTPEPTPINVFSVTYNVDGCTKVEGPDTVEYGKVFHCTIQLDDRTNTNIQLPYVIMAGKALSPTDYDWVFSSSNGKYELNITNVTGDILLYFVARPNNPNSYYITWYGDDEKCKVEGIGGGQPVGQVEPGGTFECNITARDQSNYISQIYFVLMGGSKLAQGTDFTFSNGHLIIPNVTGDILIAYNAMLNEHIGELEVDFDSSDHTAKIVGIKEDPANGITKSKVEKIIVDSYIAKPGDDQPYRVDEIAYGAFAGCSNLRELTIPFVGGYRDQEAHSGEAETDHPWLFGYIFGSTFFEGCGMITWQDFYDTDNVSEEVTAHHFMEPASIPISLESVTVTDGITLKEGAFSKCKYIENVVLQKPVNSNGPAINEIGRFAFNACAGLKSIMFSASNGETIDIGSRAFQNCTSLKTVDLTKVINIQHHAFNGCGNIHNMFLPNSVEMVKSGAFFGLYNSLIVCAKSKDEIRSSDWASDWVDEESPVVYNSPSAPVDYVSGNWHFYLVDDGTETSTLCAFIIEYLGEATGDDAKIITIPRTVSANGTSYKVCHIGTYTFIDYIYTEKFVFESTAQDKHPVVTIGHYTFDNCTGLQTIEGLYNSNLKSIGSYAFQDCEKLNINDDLSEGSTSNPVFPASLEEIGNYSFYNCSKIQKIDISGVKKIGDSGFEGCCYHKANEITGEIEYSKKEGEMLTDIRISNELESFGARCFGNCRGLRDTLVSGTFIGHAYDNIPDYCFAYTDLQKVAFPVSTKSIGIYSFAYCATKEIYINPDTSSLETISEGAFFGCSALASDVVLPPSVTFVGNSAFEECSALSKLDLTACSGVKDIPYAICYNCIKLQDFGFPKSNGQDVVKTIGAYAFGGCISLAKFNGVETSSSNHLHFPTTATIINDRALADCISLQYFEINYVEGLTFGKNVFSGWSSGSGYWMKSQRIYLSEGCINEKYSDWDNLNKVTTKWGWELDGKNHALFGAYYFYDTDDSSGIGSNSIYFGRN